VALALLGLVDATDLVVSGINPHANLSHDVTYSGTVTAAMEAVISNVKGVANLTGDPRLDPGARRLRHGRRRRPAASSSN